MKSRTLIIAICSTLGGVIYGQEKLEASIGLGFTWHNYFHEGTFATPETEPFFVSVNAPVTVSFELKSIRYKSAISFSAYSSKVLTADTLNDIVYLKNAYSIGYDFLLSKSLRAGVFYSILDNRHQLSVPWLSGNKNPAITEGIGLNISYSKHDYQFSVRKELVYTFSNGSSQGSLAPIFENWCLRIERRFGLTPAQQESDDSEAGNFTLLIGAQAYQNSLKSEVLGQNWLRLAAVLGAEQFIPAISSSIYYRRSSWVKLDALNSNFNYSSQTDYLGLAYHLDLGNDQQLKLGLHHAWLNDKGQMLLDYFEEGEVTEQNVFYRYQNKAIGVNLRYPLSTHFDLDLILDVYYQANPRIGTGFNANSLRLGLIYYLL